MAAEATITIKAASGAVFVDAVCAEGEDLALAECLGHIELAKAVLLGQAGE